MSAPVSPIVTPHDRSAMDSRAIVTLVAAIAASAIAVGQLILAYRFGLMRGTEQLATTAQNPVTEASTLVWMAAVAVLLGAAGPALLRRRRSSTRTSAILMAMFGAFLAAPVAAAIASWARMYGGNLSQAKAAILVVIGVAIGGALAFVARTSRATIWSITSWAAVSWGILIGAYFSAPGTAIIPGHLDPGPAWNIDERLLQARLVLVAVSASIGVGLGCASTVRQWGVTRRNGQTAPQYVPTPWMAASSGPMMMLVSYLVAAAVYGEFHSSHVIGFVFALGSSVISVFIGSMIARRVFTAVRVPE